MGGGGDLTLLPYSPIIYFLVMLLTHYLLSSHATLKAIPFSRVSYVKSPASHRSDY